jgi:hypothetical protein
MTVINDTAFEIRKQKYVAHKKSEKAD